MLGVGKDAANPRRDRRGAVLIQQEAYPRGSCGGIDEKPALALGGESKALEHILVGELREAGQEFRLGRARCEMTQDLADGQSGSLHARLAEADARVDGDAGKGGHAVSLLREVRREKANRAVLESVGGFAESGARTQVGAWLKASAATGSASVCPAIPVP